MGGSSRYLARSSAVQALYQWELTGQKLEDIEQSFIPNKNLKGAHLEYFRTLISQIPRRCEEIDSALSPYHNRDQDKVDLIENAILRLGAYELLYESDMPVNVVIDQAVDLAKTFSSLNSYKYVNGVLDKLAAANKNH